MNTPKLHLVNSTFDLEASLRSLDGLAEKRDFLKQTKQELVDEREFLFMSSRKGLIDPKPYNAALTTLVYRICYVNHYIKDFDKIFSKKERL